MVDAQDESWHEPLLEAIMFVNRVRDAFRNKIEKYAEFLQLMNNYEARRISLKGTVSKVQELFRDHQDLIVGFNTFLPKGYI